MVKQITCPECNGKKGPWEIIYHDDTGEWEEPFEYCSKCRGFGTVVVPGIDVWQVDKKDVEGYSGTIDIVETLDEAMDAVFDDWTEGSGYRLFHTWLSDLEENKYAPGRGYYMYEFMPEYPLQNTTNRLSNTYYIYNWIKE